MRKLLASVIAVLAFATAGTTYLLAAESAAVAGQSVSGIGIRHPLGKYSHGFGQVKPRRIFNGGDPSGLLTHLDWKSWGGKVARADGKTYTYKPHGGYYRKQVTMRLRATDAGPCGPAGNIAYRHLEARIAHKPGGQLGRWRGWDSNYNLCKHGP